jgi:hypothetical protein
MPNSKNKDVTIQIAQFLQISLGPADGTMAFNDFIQE